MSDSEDMMHCEFYAYRDHLDFEKRKLEVMFAKMSMLWFLYNYDGDGCYVVKIPIDVVDQYELVSV